jgi:arsenate reductase (glutaredoxin)
MDIVIYHNPDCGTSRNVLGLIRNAGIEPHIVPYLQAPPTRALLTAMIARAGLTVRQAVRDKGPVYDRLGLADLSLTDEAHLRCLRRRAKGRPALPSVGTGAGAAARGPPRPLYQGRRRGGHRG